MSDRCNSEIFKDGHAICALDACMHRAELWVKTVAAESGQRMDWHYSGGRANVLYIGDYDKVSDAVKHLTTDLSKHVPLKKNECGSCDGDEHRPGTVLRVWGPEADGLYRRRT